MDHSRRSTIEHPSLPLVVKQFLQWYHILAIVLFFWASYHQYSCHKILADLRKPTATRKTRTSLNDSHTRSKEEALSDQNEQLPNDENAVPKYSVPLGDWFYHVSCPHLFAEILIYLSLLACQVWFEVASTWWLVVGHVTCTLFLSARQMHSWYREKFEDYPKNRTSLFPGLV